MAKKEADPGKFGWDTGTEPVLVKPGDDAAREEISLRQRRIDQLIEEARRKDQASS
jgi:hypothetical protein